MAAWDFEYATVAGFDIKTLYIIGNGFDRHHELPTGYDHFYEHSKPVLDELEDFLQIDLSDPSPWWRDFENKLGTYEWREMYQLHDHTDVTAESFRRSEAYGLEDELAEETQSLVRKLEEQFHLWVRSIDVTSAKPKMEFSDDALFLNFNYTSTLQSVYGITSDRVFHIHGDSANHARLIFGHGKQIVEQPEQDENGDSNRTIFSDAESAAKYPLYAFQKPVNDIIRKKGSYFDDLRDVEKVVVIGHSLSDVDLPYFVQLAKNTDCCWVVYGRSESKFPKQVERLVDCGVPQEAISYRGY